MKTRLILLAATLLAAIGCSKTDLQGPETPETPVTPNPKVILTVSVSEQSKVGFEDNGLAGLDLTWSQGDQISLYDADGKWAADFMLIDESAGQKVGKFMLVNADKLSDGRYTVVYPKVDRATTLAGYDVDLANQSYDGDAPTANLGEKFGMRQNNYVYGPDPDPVVLDYSYAMVTLKLSTPDIYDASKGLPQKVVLRNGTKFYSVSMTNVGAWDNVITPYVVIDPTSVGGQEFAVDVYTDKHCFSSKLTTTKPHLAGVRYNAAFAGNSFTEVTMYTLASANTIPAGTTNIIISDAITSATSSNDFNALKTYMRTVSSNNVVLSMPNATAIPVGVFIGCTTLEEINLPMVTEIEGMAFTGYYSSACTALKTVNAPNLAVIGNNAFDGCNALTSIDLSKVTSLGPDAFKYCRELTTVDLSQISTIGASVFRDCSKLENVTLNPALNTLVSSMFSGCTSLKSLDFSNITSIGSGAFEGCSNLVITELPKVQTIGERAFIGCTSLLTLDMPEVLTLDYGVFCFSGGSISTSLTSVNMPKVTSMGSETFFGCTSLETVTLGAGLTALPENAFYYCTSLKNIDLSKVTSIGDGAFAETALKTADLSSATSLGIGAFRSCQSLETVTLGANLTVLPKDAFAGCALLKNIDLSKVTSIGDGAFATAIALTTADLSSVTSLGVGVFNTCESLAKVTLGPDLKSLPTGTFTDCPLTDINLSNLTHIGSNALAYVALEVVDLPEVVSIGESAFAGVKLKSLVAPKVTSIGAGAFGLAGSETVATIELATGIADNIVAAVNTFDNTLTSNIDLKLGSGVTGADPDTATWTPSGDNQTYTFKSIIQ